MQTAKTYLDHLSTALDPYVFRIDLAEQFHTGIESVVKAKNMMFAEIPEGFSDRIKQLDNGQHDDQDSR